jgi:L-aspartate oxidase
MGTNTSSSSSEQPVNPPQDFDILIIGSGVAALSMALKISNEKTVCLLTKESIPDTNSAMAQGGIASVSEASDSFESHIKDTLIAGAGLCKIEAVRNIVEQAPDRIQDLLQWGVEFDSDLTREGGHSHRRILHFEDQTGAEIHKNYGCLSRKNKTFRCLKITLRSI